MIGKTYRFIDMSDRYCSSCGSTKTYLQKQKIGLRPTWFYSKLTGQIVCRRCYRKELRALKRAEN